MAGELVIDSFAGGGGTSTGIEMALGRSPDMAYNHDRLATALHRANHPDTLHFECNIWQVDPREAVRNQPVGLFWASPDCTDFSGAKGGKPVRKHIRDLAWSVVLWGKRARPRVMIIENVKEFEGWAPVGLDGRRCKEREGETFKRWVRELKRLGYTRIEWRRLRACDYGAPTIRERLFVIARRDGRPIIWPAPTHGAPNDADVVAGLKLPWRTAAECIDFSLPCPSIFDTSEQIKAKYGIRAKRPLVEASMARIARCTFRYVIEAAEPFIIPVTHQGDLRGHPLSEPIRTQTTANRGEHALVMPFVARQFGQSTGHGASEPLGTLTAGGSGKAQLVAAFLAQHNAGPRPGSPGRDAREPFSTITVSGAQQNVVQADLVAASQLSLKGSDRRDSAMTEPVPTICAGGGHAATVFAFLSSYYGTDQASGDLRQPLPTDTSRDRFGLVTVTVAGQPYVITDIGMRMLRPRERFLGQGFPADYEIETGIGPNGEEVRLSETAQGRACGNSVCPQVAAALVSANVPELAVSRQTMEAAE